MKKIFCILSILAIISPVASFADAGDVNKDPGETVTSNPPLAANNPAYSVAVAHSETDNNAASAGYVKGAYNATIKAVNTVANLKQDKLSGSNVTSSGEGPVVTSVSANNGTVTVTKGEITVPIGSASSPTGHASIWLE